MEYPMKAWYREELSLALHSSHRLTTGSYMPPTMCGTVENINPLFRLKYRAIAPVEVIDESARQIPDEVPFALYPNPSHEFIAFDTTVPLKVSVISLGGTVEIESQVSGFERLDISGLQPGRYVISTRNADGKVTTSHFIKD
jgi:hypothetical protein